MDMIRRMKFWIALGLLVVVSGVVLGVWYRDARETSAREASDFQSKVQRAKSFSTKSDIRSPLDVQAVAEAQKQYEEQLRMANELLAEKGKLLEQHIPDRNGEIRPVAAHEWKDVYDYQMRRLEEDVQANFPIAPQTVVVSATLGDDYPTPDIRRAETKRYWVQRYLLQAMIKVNRDSDVIPTLKSFTFGGRPDRLLSADDATMFQPIAFEFEFAIEYRNLPMVIGKLLECEVPVAVTTVSMKRRSEVSLGAKRQEGTTGEVLTGSAVSALIGSRSGPGARGAATYAPVGGTFDAMGGFIPLDDGPIFIEERGRRGPGAGASTRSGRPQRAAAAAASTTAVRRERRPPEEVEAGRLLVDVVLKGYVRDYVAQTEEAESAESAETAGQ
ncbi:MAG: hypothetical protein GXY85_01240 [Candidatus Brocadiaceae bacterium]|nr:hypothetical protein [Candidatus Brocadiaceae bacterium]